MSIISVSKVVEQMLHDRSPSYMYTRVNNLLNGKKGRSTKKQIQQVRRIIQRELKEIDDQLAKLENE